MRAVPGHDRVHGEHAIDVAAGLQLPGADFKLIRAQHENRVIQFARHLQRPPGDAGGEDAFDRIGLGLLRSGNGECGGASGAIDDGIHIFVVVAARVDRALERSEGNARGRLRLLACGRQALRVILDRLRECLWLRAVIDEAPALGAVGTHAFRDGAEHIGQVAPHFSLVGDAREAAGPGQYAQ